MFYFSCIWVIFKTKSLKLLGDCWIINMIHWSWQTLLLKELLFSKTLQLKCKKTTIKIVKMGNLNLHINISCQSCYHIKSKTFFKFSFLFSVFFSIIPIFLIMLQLQFCQQSYNVRFTIWDSDRKYVYKTTSFCLSEHAILILVNDSIWKKNTVVRGYCCIEQRVSVTGMTSSNS